MARLRYIITYILLSLTMACAVPGGMLYSDALSLPDGPASTYIDMMRNNVRELAAALEN